MTDMPISQTNIQLYSCADESIQNAIINTYPKFFTTDPDKMLEMTEALVTQRSNHMVHICINITWRRIYSTIPDSFWTMATDCNFSCPHCQHDLSNIYIRDQFIRGIANDILQTNLLAKAGVLKSFNQNVCHAKAFESALQDQTAITDTSDLAMIQMSMYCRQKKTGLQRLIEAIMVHAQKLKPPNKSHMHHHAFNRWEFLKLYPGYDHTTDQI